jgi:hypothetical protein
MIPDRTRVTSTSPSRAEDSFCKTAMSRREDNVSCAEGLLALDEGKAVPFDEETVEWIKRAGRAKFEAAMNTKITR